MCPILTPSGALTPDTIQVLKGATAWAVPRRRTAIPAARNGDREPSQQATAGKFQSPQICSKFLTNIEKMGGRREKQR
jgi:hypothetical protein